MSNSAPSCPVCTRPAERVGRSARFVIFRCAGCSHRFLAIPEGFDLASIYSHDYTGHRPDLELVSRLRKVYQELLLPELPAQAAVLDVGCGSGGNLLVARDLGLRGQGIEISSEAVALCREQGLEAAAADFPTHDFGGKSFDLVTFWDVLEHLPEPLAFLKKAAALVGRTGAVLVKVPGHAVLSIEVCAMLPRLSGAVLSAPAHLQYFTHESLSRALATAGLPRVQWFPCPPLRTPSSGGSLKRRAARSAVRFLQKASGDGTLLALARA